MNDIQQQIVESYFSILRKPPKVILNGNSLQIRQFCIIEYPEGYFLLEDLRELYQNINIDKVAIETVKHYVAWSLNER